MTLLNKRVRSAVAHRVEQFRKWRYERCQSLVEAKLVRGKICAITPNEERVSEGLWAEAWTCNSCGQSRRAEVVPLLLEGMRACAATAAVSPARGLILKESLLMPSRVGLFARSGVWEKQGEIRVQGLATCIGAGGSVLRNHYHVLVDALSRLHWLRGLPCEMVDGLTVCVSHQLGRYEDLMRMLLPAGVAARYVPDDHWVISDQYLMLPQLSLSSCGAVPVSYAVSLAAFAARFARVHAETKRLRLFISRQQAGMRRITNFSALLPMLHACGFDVVNLESMSISCQAALFHQADMIIAAHGAGLSNLLFTPHAQVVELCGAEPRPHYRCLCQAVGHSYRSVRVHGGDKNDDFELAPETLEAILNNLLGPSRFPPATTSTV